MSLILKFIGFPMTGTRLPFQARSLGDILCDNTAIGYMRTNVFVSSSTLFKCDQRSQLDVSLYYPPVDCTWSRWTEWGACSKTCEGGNKTRTRTQNGPLYGGQECSGSATTSISCNTNSCSGESIINATHEVVPLYPQKYRINSSMPRPIFAFPKW